MSETERIFNEIRESFEKLIADFSEKHHLTDKQKWVLTDRLYHNG